MRPSTRDLGIPSFLDVDDKLGNPLLTHYAWGTRVPGLDGHYTA